MPAPHHKKSDPLRFGHARRTITPRVPVGLCGYFNVRMWESVRDDLVVDVVVMQQGETNILLGVFDLAIMPVELVHRLRRAVLESVEVAWTDMLFTCTHTHTAPEVRDSGAGNNPEYNAWLCEQCALAVREALRDMTEGVVVSGAAHAEGLSYNRRYWMTSGRVVTNPPRASTQIVRPEGGVDTQIPLLGVRCGVRLKLLLANIVNHTDTLGTSQISADWPGALRQYLESRYPIRVVPLIGTSGNINHIDALRDGPVYFQEQPDQIGRAYGIAIESTLDGLEESTSQRLDLVRRDFTVSPRQIDEQEIAEARALVGAAVSESVGVNITSEDLAADSPAALRHMAEELLRVAEDQQERRYSVYALQVGDATVVGVPGEPFVEIGLKIKHDMLRGRRSLVVSHTNAAAQYIPLPHHFANGGYETTARCCPHATDIGERLLAAAAPAIDQLQAIQP